MSFDREGWEARWQQVLAQDPSAGRPPSPLLVEVAEGLVPGRALDAGCGNGTEALWLAARGWQVTAVDFSPAALDSGRARAGGAGLGTAVTWVEGDLGSWEPDAGVFDLVACLYVHVSGSVHELVQRLGSGVAPGGTLFLVGYPGVDPATGEPTMAAGQTQVDVTSALEALVGWDVVIAEERPRLPSGVDAVVVARR